jgi:uncharacterized protein (TIGR00369 family)
MPELNRRHIDAVLELINQGPYFRHLSVTIKDIGMGYAIVELDIGREHLNPFGGLHGGVFSSIIDTATFWAAYCELEEDVGLTSIDIKVDYLAPAQERERLIARGRTVKVGRTMCLAEATVFNQDEKLLANGTSKLLVLRGYQTFEESLKFISAEDLPPKFV